MSLKRPAAGGESCFAGIFFIHGLWPAVFACLFIFRMAELLQNIKIEWKVYLTFCKNMI